MRILIQRLVRTIALVLMLTGVQSFIPAAAEWDENYGLEKLSVEQAAYANRLLAFMSEMDAKYFDRVKILNGGLEIETRIISNEFGDRHVSVTRGPVVEKIGRSISITKKRKRDFQAETVWSRRYAFDIHPETPLVGMVHAVLNFHYDVDGTSAVGGFLGILPAAMSEEDLATLKQTMDEIYEKYEIDSIYHRKLLCKGHDDDDPLATDNRYRRRPACVGGSFFSTPEKPMMSVTENNFSFMLESFDRFVGTYMNLIKMRKDDPYTAEDIAAQDAARRNWLEDQLFSDPYSTNVTAYEGWSFSNLPPNVKF